MSLFVFCDIQTKKKDLSVQKRCVAYVGRKTLAQSVVKVSHLHPYNCLPHWSEKLTALLPSPTDFDMERFMCIY